MVGVAMAIAEAGVGADAFCERVGYVGSGHLVKRTLGLPWADRPKP